MLRCLLTRPLTWCVLGRICRWPCGGDRQANSALDIALINRIRHDQRTRDYITRRTAEGRTKPEIMRCLKRYLAREAYYLIKHDTQQRTPTKP